MAKRNKSLLEIKKRALLRKEKEFESLFPNLFCPVCGGACLLVDVVDFNKSCEEAKGKFLSRTGISVHYMICRDCSFCFAPEFMTWPFEKFKENIYNDEYVLVDPDYIEARPRANASNLISMFGDRGQTIRHLDYGGGDGLLVEILRKTNWKSTSYDPFVNKDVDLKQFGKFDLVTAFEVFEHVSNVQELMSNLCSLLAPSGLILFSTLLADGNIHTHQRINWWYASPRNGHISLFSRKSLDILAKQRGFHFGSLSVGTHVFFTNVPSWAEHLIRIR
jgi:SAM-dependent methyltransferase